MVSYERLITYEIERDIEGPARPSLALQPPFQPLLMPHTIAPESTMSGSATTRASSSDAISVETPTTASFNSYAPAGNAWRDCLGDDSLDEMLSGARLFPDERAEFDRARADMRMLESLKPSVQGDFAAGASGNGSACCAVALLSLMRYVECCDAEGLLRLRETRASRSVAHVLHGMSP